MNKLFQKNLIKNLKPKKINHTPIQLRNYNKAIDAFNDGLEFVYDNKKMMLEFYSNLGDAYQYTGQYEKSDKAYEDALKIDPDNAYVLNNYSYYLSLRKEKLEQEAEKQHQENFERKAISVFFVIK